jgi:hypothetical protein
MLGDTVAGFRAEVMALTLRWRQFSADPGHVLAFVQAVGELRERYARKGIDGVEEQAIEAIALDAVSRAQANGRVEFSA